MGVKLIYQLIGHNLGIFFIIYFWHVETSFWSAVGVVPPIYVSFKAVFIISNSTSFTYRKDFALKILVQHSENISPLYFLIVSISRFLLFSKSAKWNNRSWRVFRIWVSILEYIPSASSRSLIQDLQVIWLCLHFGSAWYGWNVIINNKNNMIASGLLWLGRLCWFYFLLHHEYLYPLR